jgi:hypothetical protein
LERCRLRLEKRLGFLNGATHQITMAKGFFTQGVTVLLRQKVTLDEIEPLLKPFKIVKRKDDSEKWEFGGPTFLLEYRPEVNGLVSVDIVDRAWPDKMGDPKNESMLFGAWSMGYFGPFTFPGNFERARQHSYLWTQGREVAAQHQAFIRIRMSYVLGAANDAPVMPKDCKPLDELNFIIRVVMALLQHPAALCYFNPNGELLSERAHMEKVIEHYSKASLPPVDLWANRRMFKCNDGWMMMDTIGMRQLDLDDIEACFRSDRFKPDNIALFLGNTSLYLAGKGAVIKGGETIDGPGKVLFRAKQFSEGMATPPRGTLRFCPQDGTTPPPEFGFDRVETKKKWQFWK